MCFPAGVARFRCLSFNRKRRRWNRFTPQPSEFDLAALDPLEMVDRANTLALHEGALRYYREKGWKEP